MKIKLITFFSLFCFLLLSCEPKDLYEEQKKKEEKEREEEEKKEREKGILLTFKFEKKYNPQLRKDIEMIICENGVVIGWLNNDIDVSSLKPSFEAYNGILLHNQIEVKSGKNDYDFSTTITFDFVGDTGLNRAYTVKLAPYTGLPVVLINTEENKSITNKGTWFSAEQLIIDGMGAFGDYHDIEAEIKGRGNTTWTHPKKPYSLRLGKKESVLGMLPQRRWALIGNWMDRTLLRHHVSYHIANLTDLEWSPKGEYVELILNGEYLGNYYFCEQIRLDKNRLNITELKPDITSGVELTGGYLLEFDTHSAANKFSTQLYKLPVAVKEPDEEDLNKKQFEYIENYINNIEIELSKSDFAITRRYTDYLDINSFADWWIVHELTRNHEAVNPKSCYRYKDRNGKLKAGPVWDFDWGTFTKSESFVVKNHIWYDKLFADPVFVETVKERWKRYIPRFKTVEKFIRDEVEHIRQSEEINAVMWPLYDAPVINKDEKMSFDEAIEQMIVNYNNRLQWLDGEIDKM